MMAHGDTRPILRKSPEQLATMRQAGRRLAEVFEILQTQVRPGVTDQALDRLAREEIEKRDAVPAFLGYRGFPATICFSLDSEVVHGIPSGRTLEEGSIVGIDMGLIYNGFFADCAHTFAIGEVSPAAQRLMEVTRECLNLGIAQMREGNRIGDISSAIQAHAEAHGYGVVREYTGHGIGRKMHEAPECPNFGRAGQGKRLLNGTVIAIEPMINAGHWKTQVLEDDWTVVTADGSLSAHFEHTVAVTEGDPEILTL